jgi:CPA2 family monovalent cation:H+ antiporter-2
VAGDEERGSGDGLHHHVVIVGFGPAGQAVGRALSGTGTQVLVLDLNPAAKKQADSMGLMSQVGDALQLDVLEHARLRGAKMVVITLPARGPAMTVLEHVRILAPHAPVIVRSRHQVHWKDFDAAGADGIVGDEEEVGKRLAEQTLSLMAEVDRTADKANS